MGGGADADRSPTTPKEAAALLREARSLQRRAGKLLDAAADTDATTVRVLTEAQAAIERAVYHLARLEQAMQRQAKQARHRAR